MPGDSPKPRPFLDDLEESTVVGQPDVIPSTRTYKKPFLLQQIEGPGSPRRYVLELDEIVIGRSHQAHISIESGLLSRKHMSLRRSGLEFVAADLDSSNGMFLNGVKAHSAVLKEGDTIQIGDVVFTYHEGS
jgi:pSer/pThr/pTyr-binding forkhead associated (FHA) protein